MVDALKLHVVAPAAVRQSINDMNVDLALKQIRTRSRTADSGWGSHLHLAQAILRSPGQEASELCFSGSVRLETRGLHNFGPLLRFLSEKCSVVSG
jgi:hypothetical protein